jgi:hypothetical protein
MAKQSALEKFSEWIERNRFPALGREAVKDIRGTMHQVYFGTPEHPSEPGTPLNPTSFMTTEEVTGRKMERDMDMG